MCCVCVSLLCGGSKITNTMKLVEFIFFFLIVCLGFSLFVFSVSNMADSVGEGGGQRERRTERGGAPLT